MKRKIAMLFSAAILGSMLFATRADAGWGFGFAVRIGPPPPVREVVVACPGPNYFWIGGHWAWRYHPGRYYWVPGRWAVRRPGHLWVDGRWYHRHDGWRYREGNWQR